MINNVELVHWDGRRIGCRPSTHNRVTKVRCGFEPHPSHHQNSLQAHHVNLAGKIIDSRDNTVYKYVSCQAIGLAANTILLI